MPPDKVRHIFHYFLNCRETIFLGGMANPLPPLLWKDDKSITPLLWRDSKSIIPHLWRGVMDLPSILRRGVMDLLTLLIYKIFFFANLLYL